MADATTQRNWTVSAPHVRKAVAFIKRRKGGVTAEELVQWDAEHGRRLFTWDDAKGAEQFRLLEARLFTNRFRAVFDKMRVRCFIHIREDAKAGIDRSAYQSTQTIIEDDGMRAQVIRDIKKRMTSLASELAFWKLTPAEQVEILEALQFAMSPERKSKPAA
jgi:hypothetical protein